MSTYRIEHGDVVEVLRGYPDASFDAVLCDPPYGLAPRKGARTGFMGMAWDYDVPSAELWREVLRVCKPGAALIAFSGTRTYHRAVVQIEDAGWEPRDCIAWMYGQGFPKSLNLDGEWSGYGTALKPAFEPAVLARRPLDGTVAESVARWGVGALAIDACRVGTTKDVPASVGEATGLGGFGDRPGRAGKSVADAGMNPSVGRWPSNLILDDIAGALLNQQTGERPTGKPTAGTKPTTDNAYGKYAERSLVGGGDSGGASRFFYCPKASREERELGCRELCGAPSKARFADGTIRRCETHGAAVQSGANAYTCGCAIVYSRTGAEACGRKEGSAAMNSPRTGANRTASRVGNHHPTVKPVDLMRYLARLIMPPAPGRILVPFAGSGSEMIGAMLAGWPEVVGIEREAEYVAIARARLELARMNPRAFEAEAERAAKADARQLDMFGRSA